MNLFHFWFGLKWFVCKNGGEFMFQDGNNGFQYLERSNMDGSV